MNKYKVGQKVRIKENIEVGSHSSRNVYFATEMSSYKGIIVTIKKVNEFSEEYQYRIVDDSGKWLWDEEWFEPINEVKTKKDLRDGDIVTLANGDKLMYLDKDFKDLSVKHTNSLLDIEDLNDDLTFSQDYDKEKNNVIKVERPLTYYEAFNIEETVKELTVEEISKLLGYKVKIVKDTN